MSKSTLESIAPTISLRRRRVLQRRDALRARHDSMLRELVLAQEVQRSMLPARMPEIGALRFGAALRPCDQLAGDFYSVFRLDRDRIGVCLGDVMGHGAAAALLSVYAMQRLNVKRIDGNHYEILSPSEVLAQLNRDMIQAAFPGEPFVTMVYGVLDAGTLLWRYSSAGHPPAWKLSASGQASPLETQGPPLGIFESDYQDHEIALAHGDRLVLWSDGVDTLDWPGYGSKASGLLQLLRAEALCDPRRQVSEAIARARPMPGLSDDVALLMIRVA